MIVHSSLSNVLSFSKPLVAARAQNPMPVIGYLGTQSAEVDYKNFTVPFLQGLQEAGMKTAHLNRIYRQKDPALKEIVLHLRHGLRAEAGNLARTR